MFKAFASSLSLSRRNSATKQIRHVLRCLFVVVCSAWAAFLKEGLMPPPGPQNSSPPRLAEVLTAMNENRSGHIHQPRGPNESFPVRSFCKLMAVRLSLGPTLVPVISEHTVEAADGDKENTD